MQHIDNVVNHFLAGRSIIDVGVNEFREYVAAMNGTTDEKIIVFTTYYVDKQLESQVVVEAMVEQIDA